MILCINTSRSISMSIASCRGCCSWLNMASRACACARLRGKPSRMKPFRVSACARRSWIIARTISSDTKRPDSMAALACKPRGVPSLTAARSRSPVDICGIGYFFISSLACVPLPDPGAPNSTILIAASLRLLLFYWLFCYSVKTNDYPATIRLPLSPTGCG